ncbi:MAG: gamma-glutamylcyclotransferase family protein [Albidovulum sp.]
MNTPKYPAFFGYGSLVNRATHDYALATPARLKGWRRIWRHSSQRPLAYLSAEPAAGAEIDGLIAAVPDNDWATLDLREAAYQRLPLAKDSLVMAPDWAEAIAIYSVDQAANAPPLPILLSYLDVVLQGFLKEFGPDGPSRFFASTTGWGPIHDDRALPRYPRHQALAPTEMALVDSLIAAHGLSRHQA